MLFKFENYKIKKKMYRVLIKYRDVNPYIISESAFNYRDVKTGGINLEDK